MAENNLINETSPYLLQHAHNPVQWYAWNDEALQKAKNENKPIFLSIGYSACHWCHVMAHESFENDEVAKFMNENFVNIKVDREERPDIDDIYQKVCQIATGQGGWPLSIFLTPDQKPFYAGTYFPVLDSYGRPGFGSICRQLSQAWKEKPKDIEKSAENYLLRDQQFSKGQNKLKADVLVVPHHGSNTSSTLPFIRAVDPEYSLIPVGYRNRFRLPRERIVARYKAMGTRVLDTANSGAIVFFISTNDGVGKPERFRVKNRRFFNQ